jgi:trans-aconitate 2-methyltransferase
VWDPGQYLAFGDERARPFHDLVRRIDVDDPHAVVDLGCGPGGLTAQLAERWPNARVLGVDSSEEMIAQAQGLAHERSDGRLRFELAHLRHWRPADPLQVLVSNATLQWVPEHVELLDTMAGWLRPGGWLAFQVPGNFRSPTHALLAELRQSDRWRDQVGEGADRHLAVLDPAGYAERLVRLGLRVDSWETTYLHLLSGPDPVLEWIKGTGLRPVLARLEGDERDEFLAQYRARLRRAYPAWPDGLTPQPFRRIFVVAQRAG